MYPVIFKHSSVTPMMELRVLLLVSQAVHHFGPDLNPIGSIAL